MLASGYSKCTDRPFINQIDNADGDIEAIYNLPVY